MVINTNMSARRGPATSLHHRACWQVAGAPVLWFKDRFSRRYAAVWPFLCALTRKSNGRRRPAPRQQRHFLQSNRRRFLKKIRDALNRHERAVNQLAGRHQDGQRPGALRQGVPNAGAYVTNTGGKDFQRVSCSAPRNVRDHGW